jgi:hypothetical protein
MGKCTLGLAKLDFDRVISASFAGYFDADIEEVYLKSEP